MSSSSTAQNRLGMIAALVERAPGRSLGRTALVKLAYFLQVLRRVPLGYDFRLYTYGPFDAEVLYDLAQGQTLQVVDVQTVLNPVGYGYDIRPGTNLDAAKRRVLPWLARYDQDLTWVVSEFAARSASELELLGTIVYVDQENQKQKQQVSVDHLVQRVREIKSHFTDAFVKAKVQELGGKQLLSSLEPDQAAP
jgi:hypothetical protein